MKVSSVEGVVVESIETLKIIVFIAMRDIIKTLIIITWKLMQSRIA
jgi:hypothetical protein